MVVILILSSLLVVAVYFLRRKVSSVLQQYLGTLFVFFFLLQSTAYLAADYFTANGIDESVIYHLEYGMDGAGFVEYIGLFAGVSLLLLFALAVAFAVFRLLSPNNQATGSTARSSATISPNTTKSSSQDHYTRPRLMVLQLIFPLTFILHPAINDLLSVFNLNPYTHLSNVISSYTNPKGLNNPALVFEDFYQLPTLVKADGKSPNIVFLYLESYERTYFDPVLFPGLGTELQELEKESLSFNNIKQLPGTDWTIAGMTASQCGIPLVTPSHGNSMSGMDEFLSGATCLGDLLKKQDYVLSYRGGSSLEFAGKGKFYESHGFTSIKGKSDLAPLLEDPGYISSWGLYDDSLLDQTYLEFERLSAVGQPFGLFMLTMDTHHPKGHRSKSCNDKMYLDGENKMLNAVDCSSRLVAEFINKIRSSKYADNTVLVVASDHLAFHNRAQHLLKQGKRKNLLMIFHPDRVAPGISNKIGSTLDIAPTVLNVMGFNAPAFGLGRNLLADAPTLVESYKAAINNHLRLWNTDIAKFWDMPSIDKGLTIDVQQELVTIDERLFKLPALIEFDEDNELSSIKFEFDTKRKLINYVDKVDGDKLLVWIDRCEKVRTISLALVDVGTCIFAGKLGAKKILLSSIKNSLTVTKAQLNTLARASVSNSVLALRKTSITSMAEYGTVGFHKYSVAMAPELLSRPINIHSKGGPRGSVSSIRVGKASKKIGNVDIDSNSVRLSRGIHLLGITDDELPEPILQIDYCSRSQQKVEPGLFRRKIDSVAEQYKAFVIVSHDSAVCPNANDLTAVFEQLPLESWKVLGFRMPYIAIIPSKFASPSTGEQRQVEVLMQPIEYIGDKNHQIVVDLGKL